MPIIILKLDDFTEPTQPWDDVARYIVNKNIKAGIGIIGKCLNTDNHDMFDWVKSVNETGNFEFWNHGYNHEKNSKGLEFFGTSTEEQYSSLEMTQKLGKEKLGIVFSTFGAPWNTTDHNTILALEKIPDIKIWMHGDSRCNTKICLKPSNISCEFYKDKNKFFVEFERFKEQYDQKESHEYLILQFHPTNWNKKQILREFFKILNYLIEKPNVKFMTPNEFVAYRYSV